jgi:hypothetical protein
MKHPLLAYMMTTMAAPETRRLKAMRLIWMLLCMSLAGTVIGLQLLLALFGPYGALVAVSLCVATPIHGLIYFRAKTRADEAIGKAVEP